ncbi:MAG: bifunctional 4-hydroxy-2-oxoglutarate aldolase/2-dehydro-3-deoxy-phosphogluconate aldolase [Candidatus Gastranaerophilales bacterium]|nr:bifunctional 4-hydroxy-2-oxoglutarate aldolase/2-dehydro-3-deoxy-phosphogluconate aldolase [Candidatus Gastranaerophilales bacterium]
MKKQNVLAHLEKSKVFTVIRESKNFKTLDVVKALVKGHLTTIEISMDIPNAIEIIREMSKDNKVLLGACSIITTCQAQAAVDAGAQFLDTPVIEMSIVKFAKGVDVPLIMGASTANEAYESWKLNTLLTKIFPAKDMGGAEYISDIMRAMPFLKLIATSGVEIDDFLDYIEAGAIAVGLGKSLFENAKSLEEITQRALLVREKLDKYLAQ